MDTASWCADVINLGDIVQDSDDSVDDEERESRFSHFIELVDGVMGDEPDDVFRCLVASIRDQDDYGAHDAVLSALLRFEPQRLGRLAAMEMPTVILRVPDFAGDLLGQLAFRADDVVAAFNRAAASLDETQRTVIRAFVAAEEEDGWLGNPSQRGRIRVQ